MASHTIAGGIRVGVSGEIPANLSFSSVEIKYGINMIPYAALELPPTEPNLALLCDFDSFRRKFIRIRVESLIGCLTFDGLTDGLSMSEQYGNSSLMLTVKSVFQSLAETFPKNPGLHPIGVNFGRQSELISMPVPNDSTSAGLLAGGLQFSRHPVIQVEMDKGTTVFQKLLGLARGYIISQQTMLSYYESLRTVVNAGPLLALAKFFQNTNPNSNYTRILELLNKIDTTYVDGSILLPTTLDVYANLIARFLESEQSLFENLISVCNLLDVNLIFANNKAFLVPDIGFLRTPHFAVPQPGTHSTQPNVIFPADYNSISFSDTGYKDIRACYIVADPLKPAFLNNAGTSDLGFYMDPDTNASGGIMVVDIPPWLGGSGVLLSSPVMTQAATGIQSTSTFFKQRPEDENSVLSEITSARQAVEALASVNQSSTMASYAQLKYLKAKYGDRTGSVSFLFAPRLVPGAIASIYVKYPGLYLDCFVQEVTHRISVSAPNQGQATTFMSFNCGRMGSKQTSKGINQVDFFSLNTPYTYATSFGFANNFASDIVT